MSVKFDKTNLSNAGDWLRADGTAMAPSSVPFSVSLWVYFDSHVTNDPETVWFFGEKGSNYNYVVLEAVPDVSNETRLRVRLVEPVEQSEIQTGESGVLATDTWHLATVVVTLESGSTRLTLYVDNQSTVTQVANIGTTSEDEFDRFALGRWAGDSLDKDPCSFRAEQVAVWDTKLLEADHDSMLADKIPPDEVLDSSEPTLGYWVLAGHHRNGLRTSNDDKMKATGEGDLFNEAGSPQPPLQLEADTNPGPLWSVKTPALMYETTGTLGNVPSRDPKLKSSRTHPQFFWFTRPEAFGDWGQDTPVDRRGTHPIWDDRQMIVMARLKLTNINGQNFRPPAYEELDDYEPNTYLTQIAKRVADWIEYQGFSDETGSEGDGQYEGCFFLQNLGWQQQASGDDNFGKYGRNIQDGGLGLLIPLETHPADEVDEVHDNEWEVWFREKGEALVKEYSEEFFPLLKAELDRRELAYPKRLHWDYESAPQAGNVLPGGNDANFPEQVDGDDRGNIITADPPGEVLADGKTLGDMWAAAPSTVTEDYDPTGRPWDEDNHPWFRWYFGWKISIRNQALDTAIMLPAQSEFSGTQWSNYRDFIANESEYQYPHTRTFLVFNTPSVKPLGSFSSPVLYASRYQDTFVPSYGASERASYRKMMRDRIDSCLNATDPLPVAPWFPGVAYEVFKFGSTTNVLVEVTREDLRHIFQYAWIRGCDEYIMWLSLEDGDPGEWPEGTDEGSQDADIDATYDECKFLINTVKCVTNTKGSRTCRMSRTLRSCR